MDVNMNYQGFDLYEITPKEWILHVKGGRVFHGTLVEVGVLAVERFGFDIEQIEFATEMMLKLDHNAAHFGSMGTFIFSFQKEFGNVERAS